MGPTAIDSPSRRRARIAGAARLWGEVTLAAVSLLGALVIWHLVRRGRLLRDQLGPPRDVELPEIPPSPSKGGP